MGLDWAQVLVLSAGKSPDLISLAHKLASLHLTPTEIADCSLADLKEVLPGAPPPLILKLRSLAQCCNNQQRAQTIAREASGGIFRSASSSPPLIMDADLHKSSYFFGKLLLGNPNNIGNQRLGLWYQVTLVMATLLFALAVTNAFTPASTCGGDRDENSCERLKNLELLVWSCIALILWLAINMTWVSHCIVLQLDVEECSRFIANNVRICSLSVLTTLSGTFAFPCGIIIRVWIQAPDFVSHISFLVFGAVLVVAVFVLIVLIMSKILKLSLGETFFATMVCGLGLWPGANKIKKADGSPYLKEHTGQATSSPQAMPDQGSRVEHAAYHGHLAAHAGSHMIH
jgi:hypothetical protein